MAEKLQAIPAAGRLQVDFAFGDVYSRPQLASEQRQPVKLGALAAMGGAEPQLEIHIDLALKAVLTPGESAEALARD